MGDGALRPFEAADAVVGVQPDNQPVALGFCLPDQGDMPGMHEIEAAIGEADLEAAGAPVGHPLHRGVQPRDLHLQPANFHVMQGLLHFGLGDGGGAGFGYGNAACEIGDAGRLNK